MVTVIPSNQLVLFKITWAGETVPSAVFELVRFTVTLPVGAAPSFRTNVAVDPDSLVCSPVLGVAVMVAAALETFTEWLTMPDTAPVYPESPA